MLTQNTLDTLRQLKLTGMCDALEQQRAQPETHDLAFEERLALLVDREVLHGKIAGWTGCSKPLACACRLALKTSTTATHEGWSALAWLDWPAVTGSANP